MSDPAHYRWKDDDLLLQLRVSPRASRDQVGALMGDHLKVSITAPPVDGEANAVLVKFLATAFGVPRAQVSVVQGLSSRNKTVCISSPARLPDVFRVER